MTPNLTLVAVVACLLAAGFYLLLDRSLTRVLLGVVLLGNGTNLLLLSSGRAGGAPIIGVTAEAEMADPLPQAMILTAIVITMGMSAFLLAVIYRHWRLTRADDVEDDVEDRRVMAGGVADSDVDETEDRDEVVVGGGT